MNKLVAFLIGLLLIAVIASFFLFTIDERETAVKLRFGEVVQAGYEPGLHVKFPIVNNIVKFDQRIQMVICNALLFFVFLLDEVFYSENIRITELN